MVTGSIMECISDTDINNILLVDTIDNDKYERIYNSMNILHQELSTIVVDI